MIQLTPKELLTLNHIRNHPGEKYIEKARETVNTLCSYGVVTFLGNMQYEVNKDGNEILQFFNLKKIKHER